MTPPQISKELRGAWIRTYNHKRFKVFDPDPADIDIVDIAHALAHQCRWSGHCNPFYSVAQHSILVSNQCSIPNALWGLLHDASEAYLVDLPRPLKELPIFGDIYKVAEANLMHVICASFGLDPIMPDEVHAADSRACNTEAEQLMGTTFDYLLPPLPIQLSPREPGAAKDDFLVTFTYLAKNRVHWHPGPRC
jgi:hypothetical protein